MAVSPTIAPFILPRFIRHYREQLPSVELHVQEMKSADVISALRCQRQNANEGGVANSQHMYGEAMDIRIRGVSSEALYRFIISQPGVRYAYKINDTNVHFDIPKGSR